MHDFSRDAEHEEEESEAGAPAPQQSAPVLGPKEWVGLSSMPTATQNSLLEALGKLRDRSVNEMTVIFIGKQGVGKSSTVNTLLNERVAPSSPVQPETVRPLLAGRVAAGFTLNVLDTPGLLEGDSVSARGLMALRAALNGRKVDAFIFTDRLDTWRVDNADKAIFTSLAENFGTELWERTVLGFSHAQTTAPDGKPYDEFVNARVEQYRKAIRSTLGMPNLELPFALIENGSRCKTNGDGEKVVNDRPWLTDMVSTMVDMACSKSSYEYDHSKAGKKRDPNNKHKIWMVPVFLFQVFVLRPVMISVIRRDLRKAKK
jgi:hypothetical protein